MPSKSTRTLRERFEEKYIPEPNTGCWLWTACISNYGYGKINVQGHNTPAHRVSYELEYGKIPEGLEIDHKCRVRSCVNPRHLRAVTMEENRMAPGSLVMTKLNAEKTHCFLGHELVESNVWHPPNQPTARQCRVCLRRRANEGYHRRKVKV